MLIRSELVAGVTKSEQDRPEPSLCVSFYFAHFRRREEIRNDSGWWIKTLMTEST